MGEHLHRRRRLLAQLEQLLVALLDLLVERLVLNLELLKVDQVEAVGELLLLPQRLLQLAQHVTPVDVGEPQLLDLGVLGALLLLERLDQLERDRLARPAVLGALEDLALELHERLLDLARLELLVVEPLLHLHRRPVVLLLQPLELVSQLVDLREALEVALLLVGDRLLGLLVLLVLLHRAQVVDQLPLQRLVELEEGRLLLVRLLVQLGQIGAVVLHLLVLLDAVGLGALEHVKVAVGLAALVEVVLVLVVPQAHPAVQPIHVIVLLLLQGLSPGHHLGPRLLAALNRSNPRGGDLLRRDRVPRGRGVALGGTLGGLALGCSLGRPLAGTIRSGGLGLGLRSRLGCALCWRLIRPALLSGALLGGRLLGHRRRLVLGFRGRSLRRRLLSSGLTLGGGLSRSLCIRRRRSSLLGGRGLLGGLLVTHFAAPLGVVLCCAAQQLRCALFHVCW